MARPLRCTTLTRRPAILADGLSLAVEDKPEAIIDIATLTGAAMAALGPICCGARRLKVVEQLTESAGATGEPIWEMPLKKARYRKLLDSNVADMRNIGGQPAASPRRLPVGVHC